MEFLILLAIITLNIQIYKLSQLILTKDEQEIDFGIPSMHSVKFPRPKRLGRDAGEILPDGE